MHKIGVTDSSTETLLPFGNVILLQWFEKIGSYLAEKKRSDILKFIGCIFNFFFFKFYLTVG